MLRDVSIHQCAIYKADVHWRGFAKQPGFRPFLILISSLALISACNSPTDATRANFRKAISEFVATAPEHIEVDSFSSPQQIAKLGTAVRVRYHFSGTGVDDGESPQEALLVLTDKGWRYEPSAKLGQRTLR